MKSKNSITQNIEIKRRLQEGQEVSFVNYGLEKEEVTLAKSLAEELKLPFSLVETILTNYHTAYVNTDILADKRIQQLVLSALKSEDKTAIMEGIFQPISKSA